MNIEDQLIMFRAFCDELEKVAAERGTDFDQEKVAGFFGNMFGAAKKAKPRKSLTSFVTSDTTSNVAKAGQRARAGGSGTWEGVQKGRGQSTVTKQKATRGDLSRFKTVSEARQGGRTGMQAIDAGAGKRYGAF